MKSLITLLVTIFIIFNVSASELRSVELLDSTIIDVDQISEILINNSDSSIDSFETVNGEIIEGSVIKSLNFMKPKATTLKVIKKGGDSGD